MRQSFIARNPSVLWFLAALALFTITVTFLSEAMGTGLVSTSFLKTLGKTLCLCLVAVAMDVVWGYCGILSLGHFAFFGIGGYAIGMWLMYARTEGLVAASLAAQPLPPTRGEVTAAIGNQIFGVVGSSEFPPIWAFAHSLPLQLIAVVLVPGLLALVFGWLAFRSRVTGVYLSILTQAMTLALALYFFQNDTGLRGNNGLSGLQNIPGLEAVGQARLSLWFFWASAAALGLGYLFFAWIVSGKLGSVIRAIRDNEARVRFLGYPVERYKLFVFTVTAMVAGIAGALYYPQAGIINPAEIAPIASIYLAVWVAIGGRGRLYGAVIGAAARLAAVVVVHRRCGAQRRSRLHRNPLDRLVAGPARPHLRRRHAVLSQGHRRPLRPVHAAAPRARAGRRFRPRHGRAAARGGAGMSTLLEVSGVSKTFDGFRAINNLSIQIAEPELRAIIGPNGAGKTTFMDIVTGKTRPDEGRVIFGERSISLIGMSESRIAQAGIGRKFQKPTVFEAQSVRENIAMALKNPRGPFDVLLRRRADDREDRVRAISDEIGLTPDLDRPSGALSHGQKQWLEIGMLLAQDPRLLLVDEPAAGMTPAERAHTTDLLRRAAQTRAVVVVEHDMEFVRRLNCKVTVLHEGSVLAEGSLDHVTQNRDVIDVYLGR